MTSCFSLHFLNEDSSCFLIFFISEMFKFNFGGSEEQDGTLNQHDSAGKTKSGQLRECICHSTETEDEALSHELYKSIEIDEHVIYYVSEDYAKSNIKSEELANSLTTSDLVSGKYEGGLKVWECTYDLLNYMQNNMNLFEDKNVLDMGCGCGLLGLYAQKCKAKFVCYQDYNPEVIERFTIPSVIYSKNCNKSNPGIVLNGARCNDSLFLSGDWQNVSQHFQDKNMKFDVILSSETIYNKNYYHKILYVLQNNLTDHGIALFAAKSFYFGVGGGIYDFMEFLQRTGSYVIESVWKNSEGLVREILEIKKL